MTIFSLHLSRHAAVAALVLFASAAALAQFDPTRPTPEWLAAQAAALAAQQGQALPAVTEAALPSPQILVTGPSRKFAIVDGQAVNPGQTYNGSKLVGIDGTGTVWQRATGQERSSMTPDVEKSLPGKGRRGQQLANVHKKILNGEAK